MKQESGFTLIELLLVLAIIGIISAIAIPALLGQKEAAAQKATMGTAHDVASEIVSAGSGKGTADLTIAFVVSEPNFQWPKCKNPYTPTVSSVIGAGTGSLTPNSLTATSGPAVNNGDVGMQAVAVADAFGATPTTIAVTFKHGGVTAVTTQQNVPLLF